MEIIFIRHGQSTENAALDNNVEYNIDDVKLTARGMLQCKESGIYLKMFGKFDLIIQSPVKRCIESAKIIADKINYTKKIITDDRLTELGNVDNLSGLKIEDRMTYLEKNTKYKNLLNKISDEKNPFTFCKLLNKANVIGMDYIGAKPNWNDHYKNVKSFLENLKKYNRKYKRILVVSHGGTMKAIESIITNIPRDANIKILSRLQTVLVKDPIPIIETNNCIIMCVLYEDNCYRMVSPANNLHLLDFSKECKM